MSRMAELRRLFQHVIRAYALQVSHHYTDADDCIKLAGLGHGLGNNWQLKAAWDPAHLK